MPEKINGPPDPIAKAKQDTSRLSRILPKKFKMPPSDTFPILARLLLKDGTDFTGMIKMLRSTSTNGQFKLRLIGIKKSRNIKITEEDVISLVIFRPRAETEKLFEEQDGRLGSKKLRDATSKKQQRKVA